MQLSSIKYSEYPRDPSEWHLKELKLGHINLLVGKNATGKSRTLAVIKSLAKMILGSLMVTEAEYSVVFSEDNNHLLYEVKIHLGLVESESFSINGDRKLERISDGTGSLDATEAATRLKFKVPENELAIVAKRDAIQHPYLDILHNWAHDFRFYEFGGHMGRANVAIFVENAPKADLSDPNQVVAIFKEGDKKFGKGFTEKIVSYFNQIGYDVSDISIMQLPNFMVEPTIPGLLTGLVVSGIGVKENDRQSITYHTDMSQGMFRALSVIIHVVFTEMSARHGCICIDDIGEGLDFERSSGLIKLLMNVADTNAIQLVMATNDRFVMNIVPLEAWSILQRLHGTCEVLNLNNSRQLFEDFKLTGLNNFDFFRTEISGRVIQNG